MLKKYGHIIPIIFVMVPAFIYIMYASFSIHTKKVNLDDSFIDPSFYFTSVEITPEITKLAKELKSVKACLDYVTNIPYKIHNFRARQPIETIKQNYGDCDDKSNLLSSLLSSMGYENYIVLVPRHAFVIVNLKKELPDKKALRFNGKIFYVLESTAENSDIGFELKYTKQQIQAIINPLNKELLQTDQIRYY